MIFGFNTDVKHEETIYHVQSEAREADLLLQTQVFVRGRCIGNVQPRMRTRPRARILPTRRKSRSCASSTGLCSMPSAMGV